MPNTICYLCSPFSHSDSAVREARYEAACRAAAELIRQGRIVFSPICHSYGICCYGLPLDWKYWQRLDLRYLAMCEEVIVLKLDRWERSVGIQAEIAAARAMGKPITFISPAELGVDDAPVTCNVEAVGRPGSPESARCISTEDRA